jgi:hypothetical protein
VRFFSPNLGKSGRWLRACAGLLLLIAGGLTVASIPWVGGFLLVSAALVFFEAARGWCVLRACGIKTRF